MRKHKQKLEETKCVSQSQEGEIKTRIMTAEIDAIIEAIDDIEERLKRLEDDHR